MRMGDPVDLGNTKQKAPGLRWWISVVHQLFLRMGTARQGQEARAQSKGNSKGKRTYNH